MADDPVNLDGYRGMNAQKETVRRRKQADVQADQAKLQRRQEEFEESLFAKPAASMQEAAAKAKYLIQRYQDTPHGSDPRRTLLIARVLNDLDRHFKLD